MASLLGKKPIDIEKVYEIDLERELSVNEEFYESYKNAYVKYEGAEELPVWQLFANYLKHRNTCRF